MNFDEFLLDNALSPERLSKHPHELLNAEFLKNWLRFSRSGLHILQQPYLASSDFFHLFSLPICISASRFAGRILPNRSTLSSVFLNFSFKINNLNQPSAITPRGFTTEAGGAFYAQLDRSQHPVPVIFRSLQVLKKNH